MAAPAFVQNLQIKLNEFAQQFQKASTFVVSRVQNFKTITLQEQISYAVIGFGIVLILTSVFAFLLL